MDFQERQRADAVSTITLPGYAPVDPVPPEPAVGEYQVQVREAAGAHRRAPTPSWLTLVERWHRADLHPVPLLLDAAVVAGGFVASGASLAEGVLAAGAFGMLSPMCGVVRRRTTVESQGVLWYARSLMAVVSVMVALSFLRPLGMSTGEVAAGLAVAVGLLLVVRTVLWMVIGSARRRGIGLRPALVVGARAGVEQLAGRLATYPEAGLRFVAGYTPGDSEGARAHALALLDRGEVEHVIFVSDGINESTFQDFTHRPGRRMGYTLVLPLAHLTRRRWPFHIGDLGVLPLPIGAGARGLLAKRVFDVSVAAVLLVAVGPLMAATAIAIWLHDRGPVIFKQQRVGQDGRPFVMLKFRSMVVGAEQQRDGYIDQNVNTGLLFKVPDDPRITPVGASIRRLSIDELPQLVNVLKGDMSLVGPRPLPVDPNEFDGPARARHAVPPGITGPWQVEGGNALDYSDMVDLDLTYIATRSFGYDLQLLARTVPALLTRRSAY